MLFTMVIAFKESFHLMERIGPVCPLLKGGRHLVLVSKIAGTAAAYTFLPYVDISDMKRNDTLALFVKQDATTCILDARPATKRSIS
jgi:hypothetical protein